jgi:hypothetical protein
MAHTEDIDRWNLSGIRALGLTRDSWTTFAECCNTAMHAWDISGGRKYFPKLQEAMEGKYLQGKTDGRSNPGLHLTRRDLCESEYG